MKFLIKFFEKIGELIASWLSKDPDRRLERVLFLLLVVFASVWLLNVFQEHALLSTLNLLVMTALALFFGGMMTHSRRKTLLLASRDLSIIRQQSWSDFQEYVAILLGFDGWQLEPISEPGPDGGVDIRASRGGEQLIVQCKKYTIDRVGVEQVRAFYGVMNREKATRAMFVIPGEFTEPARREFTGIENFELIDGVELMQWMERLRPLVERFTGDGPTTVIDLGVAEKLVGKGGGRRDSRVQINVPWCGACNTSMVLGYSTRTKDRFWICPNRNSAACATKTVPLNESERNILHSSDTRG